MTEITTECDRGPLTAFIVTMYVPDGVEDVVDNVTVVEPVPPAESATVLGLNPTEKPGIEVGKEAVKDAPPVRPTLVRVSVLIAEPPATKLAGVTGPGAMENSGSTVNAIVAPATTEPLTPVIVMM